MTTRPIIPLAYARPIAEIERDFALQVPSPSGAARERDGATSTPPRNAPSRSGCNPDRFDRLIANATGRPAEREPVITSKRQPRFVDHATCSMCGVTELGVEYHGELRDGTKVHQLAAHTAGMRRVERKQPRCLGAGMRVAFVDGGWHGAPKP